MKPKTKLQKAVASVQCKVKPLTNAQKKYAEKKCFEKTGVFSKTTAVCYECGQSWVPVNLVHEKKTACPCCGQKIKMIKTRGRKKDEMAYFSIVTVIGEFQLCRLIHIRKVCRAGSPAVFHHSEVMQHFIDSAGELTLYSVPINGFSMYLDSWCFHGQLELRDHTRSRASRLIGISPDVVYVSKKALPIFYRNGFTGKFFGMSPADLLRMLRFDSKAETLIKANQISLLRHHYFKGDWATKHYWNSIKLCLRNQYHVEDASSWFDYLKLLEYFKKDIKNPTIVCPVDFHAAHNKLVQKKRVIDDRIAEQRRIERDHQIAANSEKARLQAIKDAQDYQELKSKFFGLNFSDGKIVVCVLKSLEEFKEEGDQLMHCLHTNSYFRKKDSLIMSARIDGKPVETIEFNLEKGQVIQCRGLNNKPTTHHNKILQLVKKNTRSIMRLVG